jgi:hypothetical protein
MLTEINHLFGKVTKKEPKTLVNRLNRNVWQRGSRLLTRDLKRKTMA